MRSVKPWLRGKTAFIAAIPFVLASTVALGQNPNSIVLPNGANLSVEIFNPTTDQEFKVPAALGPGGTINVLTDGEASIGQGAPNVHLTFIVDVSGSTGNACGGGLGSINDCEKSAVSNVLGDPNITSVVDVGVSVFGSTSFTGDMGPGGGAQPITGNIADAQTVVASIGVNTIGSFTAANVGAATCFSCGLTAGQVSVAASGAGTKRGIMLSDGLPFNDTLAATDAALVFYISNGVQVDTLAVGGGAACGAAGTNSLQHIATQTGGTCTAVPNPANLPGFLPNLVATTLLQVGATLNTVPVPTNVVPLPPVAGPTSVLYDATYLGLGVGDYISDAFATGSDSSGQGLVVAVDTFHLLQLTATPPTATNECGPTSFHTVDASILGGTGPARDIDFDVTGANTAAGSASATPGGAAVSFTYGQNDPANLGDDTITVSTTIAGMLDSVTLQKTWVDTTPPTVTAALVPVGGDDDSDSDSDDGDDDDVLLQIEFACSDICDPNVTTSATLNGIPVVNGQVVDVDDDDSPFVGDDDADSDDGPTVFTLVVTCTDASGIVTTETTTFTLLDDD